MMIRLTRLDGSVVWFGNGFTVEPVFLEESTSRANTKVTYNGTEHYLKEDVNEVVQRIEETGK